jgi:hypothetical protein
MYFVTCKEIENFNKLPGSMLDNYDQLFAEKHTAMNYAKMESEIHGVKYSVFELVKV